jgi:hypothetical protein
VLLPVFLSSGHRDGTIPGFVRHTETEVGVCLGAQAGQREYYLDHAVPGSVSNGGYISSAVCTSITQHLKRPVNTSALSVPTNHCASGSNRVRTS